jgi:hypothetical protein
MSLSRSLQLLLQRGVAAARAGETVAALLLPRIRYLTSEACGWSDQNYLE